jgi:hypothetical protein
MIQRASIVVTAGILIASRQQLSTLRNDPPAPRLSAAREHKNGRCVQEL